MSVRIAIAVSAFVQADVREQLGVGRSARLIAATKAVGAGG
jgi:hypothetical protein